VRLISISPQIAYSNNDPKFVFVIVPHVLALSPGDISSNRRDVEGELAIIVP